MDEFPKYFYRECSSIQAERSNTARRHSECAAEVSRLHCNLNEAEKSPAPVIQPLPSNESLALRVLFFLQAPDSLRVLSYLSFTAQQMLLPSPLTSTKIASPKPGEWLSCDVGKIVRANEHSLNWLQHYKEYERHTYKNDTIITNGSASEGSVTIGSGAGEVPKHQHIGPSKVMDCRDRSHGVWYPDDITIELRWCEGINPFAAISPIWTTISFTEKLPKNASNLQWAMYQPGCNLVDKTRNNLPFANQDLRPLWLNKPAFLSFCNLRAYPRLQLRELIVAIKNRLLPLSEPATQIMIQPIMAI